MKKLIRSCFLGRDESNIPIKTGVDQTDPSAKFPLVCVCEHSVGKYIRDRRWEIFIQVRKELKFTWKSAEELQVRYTQQAKIFIQAANILFYVIFYRVYFPASRSTHLHMCGPSLISSRAVSMAILQSVPTEAWIARSIWQDGPNPQKIIWEK